ncbi:MAG: FAD-dependent oxidoreductase [Bacteroidota bacterium]
MSKQVLILGGGFAGVESAIYLRKKGLNVTLVSDRDYLFIYPISIWIPVSKMKFEDATIPLEKLAKKHKFELIIDKVQRISAKDNSVELGTQKLSYDYLVVALGGGKLQHKGSENFMSICGQPDQSVKMKEKFDTLLAKGSGKIAIGYGGNPKDKTGVRGGPAFEILFNFLDVLKKKGIRDQYDITFFATMKDLGKRMGKSGYSMLGKMFEKEGINSRTGKKIKEFLPDKVVFEDDSVLETDYTMFIPGGTGHPILDNSDLPLSDSGFVKIDNHSQVEGFENVYAIGDVAKVEGPDWVAKQGHIAEVMAKNTAYNISEQIKGSSKRKGYSDHLNILCVMDTGNGAAFTYRKDEKDFIIPLPIVGHWLKKGWGFYYKNSKLNRIPRIPGM